MLSNIHLIVDAMGGDQGPHLSVPASLSFLQQYSDTRITLVGDSTQIHAQLQGHSYTRLNVVHASDAVAANDKPSYALRHRRESSLWRSLELLAQNHAHACVSAGNTGALMAMSKHLVGTFSAVDRPAICKAMPTATGFTYLLDLGANLGCTAEQLVQFAVMGVALARTAGVASPRVALLNVGAEEGKGSSEIQQAASRLQGLQDLDFTGFVEGDALYTGVVDVIVCDGFSGNVALKVSEGAARLLFSSLDRRLRSRPLNRLAAWLIREDIDLWQQELSPARYNGAALLGLQKPVIKSHGGADQRGFCEALAAACEQVRMNLVEQVGLELQAIGLDPSS